MTLLTEKEARDNWCPMARVTGLPGSEAEGISWNRHPADTHPAASACCIASRCMMWRFGPVEFEYQPIKADTVDHETRTLRVDKGPPGEGWASGLRINQSTGTQERVWKREKPRRGYCGLAGRVEP